MCIFSQPVDHVGSTRILVSDLGGGNHGTAYQMAFRAPGPVAMILPVPVAKGSGDDALTFIDLSGYDAFFSDLSRCFPERSRGGHGGGGGYGMPEPSGPGPLAVHEVGQYDASFVPSIADFPRLDPRFRLSDAGWESLPDYQDFGFAVFRLRPGDAVQEIHPFAYRYPAECPGEMFFPTAHIHDGGRAVAVADYDHYLYFQREGTCSTHRFDFEIGSYKPGMFPGIAESSRGLVAPDVRLARLRLRGDYPNADVVVLEGSKPMRIEARTARAGSDFPERLDWVDVERMFPKTAWQGRIRPSAPKAGP